MKVKEHFQVLERAIKYTFCVNKKYTLLLILNKFLSSIVMYIPIYYSAKIIDYLIARDSIKVVISYVILTVGLVFLINFINAYICTQKNVAYSTIWRNEDWTYAEKSMNMAYESLEDSEITNLRYRIKRESQTGQNLFFFYRYVEEFIGQITKIISSFTLTISFFCISVISIELKFLIGISLILVCFVQVYTIKKTNKITQEFNASTIHMNIIGEQFLDYIKNYSAGKDIRLYNMGDFLRDSYLELDKEYWESNLKNSHKQALWTLPVTILSTLLKFFIYVVLIYAAFCEDITVGSIAKYVTCLMLLIRTLVDFVKIIPLILDNNVYLKRYFSYFDISNTMVKGNLTIPKCNYNKYELEFRHVSFKYPNTENYALKDVNLKFDFGKKYAIVGKNGSGKTTFIKLLCRLYDPTEGEILLNGVNIQKYDYNEYMSMFSVVFQDFSIFHFQLGEIVASNKQFDEKKVERCLRKANFGDMLDKMPKGVQTYLYKGFDSSGIELSGGEAQKIALARALYKDAAFILLDEPTAALDPISEYEVYSSFNAISEQATVIYISHRLASCRFCDRIIVFDDGAIVQYGSHQQLMDDPSKIYYNLWQAQAQYYN